MKTIRLSFKLIGVLLAAVGIGGCGDDDSGGGGGTQNCITCTYSYGTYTDTYTFCKDDADVIDQLEYAGITWAQFVTGLKFAASGDDDLDCD